MTPPATDAINHDTKACLAAKMPLGMFGLSADAVAPVHRTRMQPHCLGCGHVTS